MKNREKGERWGEMAKELANSGKYADHIGVEIALRSMYMFRSRKFTRVERQEYDEMCEQAQGENPKVDG